jgi:hypothetical protein
MRKVTGFSTDCPQLESAFSFERVLYILKNLLLEQKKIKLYTEGHSVVNKNIFNSMA